MDEKVSIIVPVYNGEKYITRCIESIVKQTYLNIEIIIVNDGSVDNTEKIINNLAKKDERIKTYSNKNKGVSYSRNFGIRNATGKYICFVDSDDWIEKDMIQSLLEMIKKYDYDIVRCSYAVNKNNGAIINYKQEDKLYCTQQEKKELLYKVAGGKIPSFSVLLLIKKDKILEKFDETIPFMEDTIFFIDLLRNIDKIYFTSKILYHYFDNDSSATKSIKNIEKNIESLLNVNKKLKEKLKDDIDIYEIIDNNHCYILINMIYKYMLYADFSDAIFMLNRKDIRLIIENVNIKKSSIAMKIPIILIKNRKYRLLRNFIYIRSVIAKIKHIVNK